MKIILASEVILKGLDPTKPHKALDSNGRLAMISNEHANSTISSFLPSTTVEQALEQIGIVVQVPVEVSTDVPETLTTTPALVSVEPVVSEPTPENPETVTANIPVDESALLENEKVATVTAPSKGKGKAAAKKAS
jgi:hypothetical protein